MNSKFLAIYPDTYYAQGKGALILLQIGYTAICIGRSKKKKFVLHLFGPKYRFKFIVTNAR